MFYIHVFRLIEIQLASTAVTAQSVRPLASNAKILSLNPGNSIALQYRHLHIIMSLHECVYKCEIG